MPLNRLPQVWWDVAFAQSHCHADLLRRLSERGEMGNVLEIGCAAGGSALALISLVPDEEHFLVTVDPWGSRPYKTSGARYGADFQRGALATLGRAAYELHVNWHHCKMTSLEFFEHVAPLGCWYRGEKRQYDFQTVFLDGEHMVPIVMQELDYVRARLGAGNGVIFVDNANHQQGAGIGMEQALQAWADESGFTCELISYPDNDMLAELRPVR